MYRNSRIGVGFTNQITIFFFNIKCRQELESLVRITINPLLSQTRNDFGEVNKSIMMFPASLSGERKRYIGMEWARELRDRLKIVILRITSIPNGLFSHCWLKFEGFKFMIIVLVNRSGICIMNSTSSIFTVLIWC